MRLLALLAFPSLGIAIANIQAKDEPFVSFSQFLGRVHSASYGDFKNTAIRDEYALDEAREHIQRMYSGVRDPSSIKSYVREGQFYLDCIPMMQQPTVHLLNITEDELVKMSNVSATLPQDNTDNPQSEDQLASLLPPPNTTDACGNRVGCPEGAVPIRRLTLERISRFETLYDFFQKRGTRTPPITDNVTTAAGANIKRFLGGSTHLWEDAKQNTTSRRRLVGASSTLNVWSPRARFSISQMWLMTHSPTQTVEAGWIVYPDYYGGDDRAHFFHYFTRANYDEGTGCYDTDCAGFVQLAAAVEPGAAFSHYSAPGGDNQWVFRPFFEFQNSNWYLFLRTGDGVRHLAGFYPGVLFVRDGGTLAAGATDVKFGGEVADVDFLNVYGEMGSGRFAEEGFGASAYQKVMQVLPDPEGGPRVWQHASLTATGNGAARCYSQRVPPVGGGEGWHTYMFFGGPGGH